MEDSKNDQPTAGDLRIEYKEEKIRMGTSKTSMPKSIKRLENTIQEFSNLEGLNLPESAMVRDAKEVK